MTDRSHQILNSLNDLADWGTVRDVLIQELTDQGLDDEADVIRSEFTPDHALYPDLLADLVLKANNLHPITQNIVKSQGSVRDIITAINAPLIDELGGLGNFDDASDWTLLSGWSVTGGVLSVNVAAGSNTLAGTNKITIDTSARYRFEFDIVSYTSGSVNPDFIGPNNVNGPAFSGVGTHSAILTPGSIINFIGFEVVESNGFVGDIDNFRLYKLG